ncbi:MAG: hypothetical protein HY909_17075 [Deltaproteobacteria bacterium]|nr:hypothetical protein [Deltaproteobacteria bacterium]
MDPAVEAWLPTLDEARSALEGTVVGEGIFRKGVDLGAIKPSEVYPLAAVLLVGRALVRERWTQELDLSRHAMEAMEREAPAPQDYTEQTFRCLRRVVLGPSRCTNCPARPGLGPCTQCAGTGYRSAETPCSACQGGFALCAVCDGTAVSLKVSVEYLRDVVAPLGRVFLPRLPGALKSALARDFDPGLRLPDALLLSLERPRLESAYRGPSRVRAPDFHGHAFEGAFESSLEAQEAFREAPGVRLSETRAWAWPLLWLRYNARGAWWDVAAYRDRQGTLRTTLAEGVG